MEADATLFSQGCLKELQIKKGWGEGEKGPGGQGTRLGFFQINSQNRRDSIADDAPCRIKGVACIRDVGCMYLGFAPYLVRIRCPEVRCVYP